MKLTVFRLAKWFSILSFGTLVILSFWFWFTPVGINNYVNKITIQLALNDPETLTSVGLIDNTILDFHSGRLSDYTEEGEQNNLVFAKKARAGLDFYGPDGLIGEELLTWKITAQFLDDIIEGDQFQHDHYRINQISGVTIDIPSFLTDTHQILNNKSINRYLSRLREFGRVLGEVKVDTGLHAFSWSREDAILYMIKKTGMTEDEVVREIERYVVWPGQATAYKIGQLALLEMRDRAESSLGDKFDLKDFHKLILGSGAMPLDLLSEQVDS